MSTRDPSPQRPIFPGLTAELNPDGTPNCCWYSDQRYEAGINKLLLTDHVTVLCQYDPRRFSGATIIEQLDVRPVMIVNGQIMRSKFCVAPVVDDGATNGDRDG